MTLTLLSQQWTNAIPALHLLCDQAVVAEKVGMHSMLLAGTVCMHIMSHVLMA